MPGEEVVLDPENLVKGPHNGYALAHADILHAHHCADQEIFHVCQCHAHVHVLDAQLRLLGAVLESGLASMHDAYVVQVFPEWGVILEVRREEELDQVVL